MPTRPGGHMCMHHIWLLSDCRLQLQVIYGFYTFKYILEMQRQCTIDSFEIEYNLNIQVYTLMSKRYAVHVAGQKMH